MRSLLPRCRGCCWRSGGPGQAQIRLSPAPSPRACCAARRSPRPSGRSGIPAHLLAAISRVESGRRDPATGAVHPWPWTVNAEGQGFFYDTKAEAVAAVRAMQARGIRSIDVGCGQINLMHHPDAFPNLELAFDPQANAAYAARFLKELFAQTGDWTKATGAVSLGDARTGRRVPATGAGGLAGGAAASRPGRRDAAGAGLGRHDRSATARASRACCAAAAGSTRVHGSSCCPPSVARRRPAAAWTPIGRCPIGLAYQPPPRPHRRVASGGELGADRRGVLADRRHRPQRARAIAEQHRRRGERDRAVRRLDRRPPQCRMTGERRHVVDEAVGRVGGAQFRGRLRRASAARTPRRCAHPPSARLATRITLVSNPVALRQVRLVEELRAELHPFALVLDGDQHQRAVRGGERAVGADRGMREAKPLRRACRCPRRTAAARSSSRPCRRTG